jgi:hypothetical protein
VPKKKSKCAFNSGDVSAGKGCNLGMAWLQYGFQEVENVLVSSLSCLT